MAIEVTIKIPEEYKDRIAAALRNMKPALPDGATDLEVFNQRIREMIKKAVVRTERKLARASVTVPDDLMTVDEEEIDVPSS